MHKGYCLNELQQIVEVNVIQNKENPNVWDIKTGALGGLKISKEFLYEDESQARTEIELRHQRLNKAFKSLDLLKCLSINKEPARKLQGYSQDELNTIELKDRKSYKNWLNGLEKGWEEINHERPDLDKLSKTLKNANLIQKALKNPLAIEFIEIMSKEAKLKKAGKTISQELEP
jgi:hypothetical protein